MQKRLTLFIFSISFLFSLVSVLLMVNFSREILEQHVRKNVRQNGVLLARAFASDYPTKEFFEVFPQETRVTLIDSFGKVIEDSWSKQKQLETHENRAEFLEALKHGEGESVRFSKTFDSDFFYYALRLKNGNVLRISYPLHAIDDALLPFYFLWGIWILILFFVSWRFSIWFTKKLLAPIQVLSNRMESSESLEGILVYGELESLVHKIRKQGEDLSKQLRRMEKERLRLSTVVQNITEGLLLLSRSRRVLHINEAAKNIFGLSEESLEKTLVLENYPLISEGLEIAYGGETKAFECELSKRTFRVILNPVFRREEVIGVVCLFMDISDRKAIEKMRRDFTANVSHELKTPLTSISGYAEIIEAGFVPESEIPGISKKIQKEASRLLELINDIIKLTELDSADEIVEMDKVNLLSLVKECCEDLAETAKRKNVSLNYSGENLFVQGNYKMLYEMIYNLIDNGIRYNIENGALNVVLENFKLKVCDTGIGIPEKHQNRIFERFYRVDKSRSKATGGTGLGLAIVKHIAECHRIGISLKSSVGVGTEIELDFSTQNS